MLGAAIERALRWSPQLPRYIEFEVGRAMCDWLENYMAGLHSATTSAETKVASRAASLESTVRKAHNSLQSLIQQGQGDGRPAVGVIVGFVREQISVVTSHDLNVSIWGSDGALEMERRAIGEARIALNLFRQIDPEWSREQEEILQIFDA